jgi:hypothetical protein
LEEEINFIRSVITPIVEKHYSSKANHEKMSLYDLITFGIMAHKHFDGIYKKAYRVLIEDLKLFPKVRYNKVVERLNRYEKLLMPRTLQARESWTPNQSRQRNSPGSGGMRRRGSV